MSVLISIKPKYVENIINKSKRYEFRKKIHKDNSRNTFFIYSSSPTKKIVGHFKAARIINDTPKNLWSKCSKWAGIEEKDFFEYFENKDMGYAIEISDLTCYSEPIDPKKIKRNFVPPQSFYYIDSKAEKILVK